MADSPFFSEASTVSQRVLFIRQWPCFEKVKKSFNAAELDWVQIAYCLGFQIAKVQLRARHVQK
jgi:hypothetical protein